MTPELDREGPSAPPRRNGELVFEAPWERQLFGVTMALHERGVFAWSDFSAHLSDEIAGWTASAGAGDEYVYYEHWERALSRLLDERGVIDPAAVDARAREIAALPPGHDHDNTTTTRKERHMAAASIRLAGAVSAVSDRLLATGFLAVGALIVYLVLFDQGAAAAVLFGSTAGNENVLHELFHDGRHLLGAPCH